MRYSSDYWQLVIKKIEYSEFSKDVLSNYWWVIMVIVGFYFGGRSAENIVTTIFEKWADVRTKQTEDAKIRANKKERLITNNEEN